MVRHPPPSATDGTGAGGVADGTMGSGGVEHAATAAAAISAPAKRTRARTVRSVKEGADAGKLAAREGRSDGAQVPSPPYTRIVDLAFPPGVPPERPGPLARFLPPIERGAVTRFLASYPFPEGWLLDPFGSSPLLAIEAAQSRGVVAAFSNAVTRFVLESRIDPLSPSDLRAALAQLAAAPKDDTRLERFLLELYRSECARCGAPITADHFIWDRELQVPVSKAYACEACHHSGEDPTTPADRERAVASAGYSLAHALAAERAAAADDQDRDHVEAALAVYPARAVYALVTLLQKLEQIELTPGQRRAAEALLISTFDAANGLWGYPESRARPKALTASPRFREINVWRALERARDEWPQESPGVRLATWPESGLPSAGVLAVFPGPIRDLAETLPSETPAILTALPRPNQAYWTLSALWASWLWGREAAAPIKIALRRRRYDWTWHAAALRGAFQALARRQPAGAPAVAFLPEAESGFVAAALAGLDAAGYRLRGQALRLNDGQAVLAWEATRHRPRPEEEPLGMRMAMAAEEALLDLGEPAGYGMLHAAAVLDLAQQSHLAELWATEETPPLTRITEEMEMILAPGGRFERMEPRADLESGHYWLAHPERAAPPLSDRVEMSVLEMVRSHPGISTTEVEALLCENFRGLRTPDRRLVLACLTSYAVEDPEGRWRIRPEDEADARSQDIAEITSILDGLGGRLGYRVVSGDDTVVWEQSGRVAFRYRVQGTAVLAAALGEPATGEHVIVLPGGRAPLVAEKERRDPRLRAWLEAGGRIVKFRHIRRLAAESSLQVASLPERLGIDPPEHKDPQLPLL